MAKEFLNFLPAHWALLPAPRILRNWLSSTQFWMSKCTCLEQTSAHPHHQAGEESIFGLPRAMGTPTPLPLAWCSLRFGIDNVTESNCFTLSGRPLHGSSSTASAIYISKIILDAWTPVPAMNFIQAAQSVCLKTAFARHYQSLREDRYRATCCSPDGFIRRLSSPGHTSQT